METLDTADTGSTHATGDNGGVARLATMARQDTLGGDHALQVVGVGLPANQNDLMTLGRTRNGVIAREHDLAHGGTGTGVKAACERLVLLGGVELRVQELVELRGVDAAHGLLTGDKPSSTISIAMRRAAVAVRLPTRVWSIQSLPCSMVNSMSHISR